jgi:uncharacterized protein (DUF433 family)
MNEAVSSMSDGSYRVAGTRVSLDSIIHAYWNGESVEVIVESFPSLSRQQVEQAIDYYLRNRSELDAYMKSQEQRWTALERASGRQHRELIDKINTSATSPR